MYQKQTFLFENADFIRELSLLGNAMPILYKETFRGLYKHKILDISSMSMKIIEDHVFEDLVRLQKLAVNNNHLQSLPNNFFKPLENFVPLEFNQCHFKKLPNLKGLPSHLLFLSLGENKIENVSSIIDMGIS